MKKLFSLVVFITFLGAIAFAQNAQPHKKHRPKKSKEHKAELRQHYEQKVYPVLKSEHKAFEAALSAEDMNFLSSKRAEADQLHQEQRNIRKKMKEMKAEGKTKEEIKAEFASQRESLKAKRKSLIESLKPFVEKNESLIQKHMENLKPYHQQWKSERQAIHQKYLGDDFQDKKAKHTRKNKGNHPPKGHADKKQHKVKKKVVKFLLWDGELKKRG